MEENERLMSSTEVVGDEEESIRPGSLDADGNVLYYQAGFEE